MTASAAPPPWPRRPPAAAGVLYPDDPIALGTLVRAALDGETASPDPEPPPERAVAVVAPHGGLRLSGGVAGAVYRRVEVPRVAIVLSPRHADPTRRPAIQCTGVFGMPGGDVPIAEHVAEALRDAALLRDDPEAHRTEHGVELQLPFLRARATDVEIVPVLVGDVRRPTVDRLAAGLADVVIQFGRDVLLVASADLGRGRDGAAVRAEDDALVDALEDLDPKRVRALVHGAPHRTCAAGVLATVVTAARALGARRGTCIARATSADAGDGTARVVGYAGLVIR